MKNSLLVLSILALFIITACGPTKVAVDPYIGIWDVTIKDTPQGDIGSVMTIAKGESGLYEANVKSDIGNFDLYKLQIANNKLSSSLTVQDMEFDFTGTFNGDTFTGYVSNLDGEFRAVGRRTMEKME